MQQRQAGAETLFLMENDMSKKDKIVTITLNPAIDLACTVPGFTYGAVNRVVASRTDAGGKGVNIARLLRQFELPVAATGFLGEDNPHLFEKLFRNLGIEDAFVRVPGETRIGIKILDPSDHSTTDLNLPGLSPQQQQIDQLLKTVKQQAEAAALVIIAGSIPVGLDAEIVAQLVKVIKQQGAKAYVDTSGPALRFAIDARPSLVKPNIDELSEYVGRPLQVDEAIAEARKLVNSGIETVVVSLGAEGAFFVDASGCVQTKPPEIEAVSTVGAGDAMVGSLAAGLLKGLSLAERAKLATAVSAAIVTHAGPGLSSLDETNKLELQVLVTEKEFDGGTDE
ncbi:fructose-1-phosphate kinase [Malonomonas rubra DSM 5091]|uniref:Fructose-1-phosphate kinase n=1 Tax=Malonomonas rubra DSM 5091 TaxID=1122189 RepID=A0A1M6IPI5_MALRU|nr:1-phosphofructokinase [Malonomonas rubra]SHJ36343.1 fructose-1-phosphate kinase [Malonomonas rubra DSM 5091]